MQIHKAIAPKFGVISSADFKSPNWACNPHLQTILPRYFVKHPNIKTTNERISTPDGDFLDLAWSVPCDAKHAKALVVIFHGLEGSIDSHYIKHLVNDLNQAGYISVLMHFRGCGLEKNITHRAYHSGEVEDPIQTIRHAQARYPDLPTFCVGFSLGGNMLMNLVAEHAHRVDVKTAMAISSPLNLSACARRMEQGFSRVYQQHLIKSMRTNLVSKYQSLSSHEQIKMLDLMNVTPTDLLDQVQTWDTFYQFDDKVTAPLHGFDNAQSYYDACSALPKLINIEVPSLIVHANDDPFMDKQVIPSAQDLSPNVAYELSAHGGHVGFMHGSLLKPKLWLASRIMAHFNFIKETL